MGQERSSDIALLNIDAREIELMNVLQLIDNLGNLKVRKVKFQLQ